MADNQIASFLTFTSSSSEEAARQYLEMAGNDLERAVGLFMEMGGENGLNGGTGVGLNGGTGVGLNEGSGVGPSSNNNDVASSQPPGSDGLDPSIDAATRAAIRAAQGPDSNTIRAPDETRTMRLVGGDSPHRNLMAAVAGPQYHPDLHDVDDIHAMGSAIWGNINNADNNNIADVRSNINREAAMRSSGTSNDDAVDLESDDDDDSYVNIDGRTIPTNAANSNNNNAPSLSTMFSPPTHLMHRAGGFQGARNVAKDARRWLLVNVQDDGDFACHALNRDVWREELVENLVREGFIFWQVMSTNPEGRTYITRYKVEGYPHIAIIDPRTGALLWRKEGWTQVNPLTAEQFVEIASDFCSRHSFSKQPAPAKHGYNNSNTQPSNKRPIQELSEEEQLQAAIRASMMQENDEMDEGINDAEKSMENDVDNEEKDDDAKPAALNTFEQEILALDVGDEPTSGNNVARIQIRMPDGKRLVRKFKGDDSVKIIYAFVAQSNEEAKSGEVFELKAKFPPQDLLSSVDESISSCGLNGEAINVMWK